MYTSIYEIDQKTYEPKILFEIISDLSKPIGKRVRDI